MQRNSDVEKSQKRSSRSEKELKEKNKDNHRRNETIVIEEKMKNNATMLATSSTIHYKGKEKLENYLAGYENKISNIQTHVSESCDSEIKAFEEARDKLEKKLKVVMSSKKMQKMEDQANEAGNDVSSYMKHMQQEIESMRDKIQDDHSLSNEEKQNQGQQLRFMAIDEIKRLNDKYPSAMKAQMMAQMLLLR